MKWLIAVGALVFIVIGFLFFKLPQPIIELKPEAIFHIGPLAVTNTMFTSWVMIALIVLVTKLGTRKLTLIPRGFQNLFEAVVDGFGNIANGVAGEQNGRRFFPLVFILFLYIVLCNWAALLPIFNVIGVAENVQEHVAHEAEEHPDEIFAEQSIQGWVMEKNGVTVVPLFTEVPYLKVNVPPNTTNAGALALLDESLEEELGHPLDEETQTFGFIAPYFRGVNTDVNAPLAYAIWSFIFVEFWGASALGLLYFTKFFNFRRLFKGDILNGLIDVFVGILELISEFARLISFTFRLFGNIFAGEVLLFMMSFLISFLLVLPFFGLEIFVGLVQAFVFAMLTLVFGVMAVSGHGDHDEHGEAHGAAPHTTEGHV